MTGLPAVLRSPPRPLSSGAWPIGTSVWWPRREGKARAHIHSQAGGRRWWSRARAQGGRRDTIARPKKQAGHQRPSLFLSPRHCTEQRKSKSILAAISRPGDIQLPTLGYSIDQAVRDWEWEHKPQLFCINANFLRCEIRIQTPIGSTKRLSSLFACLCPAVKLALFIHPTTQSFICSSIQPRGIDLIPSPCWQIRLINIGQLVYSLAPRSWIDF